MTDDPGRRPAIDDPPPIFRTWRRLYGAVLVYLFLMILAFWLFGRSATP